MLSKPDFVSYVLGERVPAPAETVPSALPGEYDGFAAPAGAAANVPEPKEFARDLLKACFDDGQAMPVHELLLADKPEDLAKYAPGGHYWAKTPGRPFHVVLLRLAAGGQRLVTASPRRTIRDLALIEDELDRHIQDGLSWFARRGAQPGSRFEQGNQTDTLLVVSVTDDRRTAEPRQLLGFGTKIAKFDALETFFLREDARDWVPHLAEEHFAAVYDRHITHLVGIQHWQKAFTTGEHRNKASDLLEACAVPFPTTDAISTAVQALIREVGRGFGPRARALVFEKLRSDHYIATNPDAPSAQEADNPLEGLVVRDALQRVMGYVVYCVDDAKKAKEVSQTLKDFNVFDNVVLVYPDGGETTIELWQGRDKVEGRLRRANAQVRGAGKVVGILENFFKVSQATVRDPKDLAESLAKRARYLRTLAIRQLGEEDENGHLRTLFASFKKSLIADLDHEHFADYFAQTVTNGLLTARWATRHDTSRTGPFTVSAALGAIPVTNPFLRGIFKELDKVRRESAGGLYMWMLEDIASLLERVDVRDVFDENPEDTAAGKDPVIHFFEDFLAAYDPTQRMKLGVYYTPRPVVSFIARSVHTRLQRDFELTDGLADISTWGDMLDRHPGLTLPEATLAQDRFVNILDPATGTGTFLVEVIDVIHRTMLGKWRQQGHADAEISRLWNEYVSDELLPRLHGFELLMAPYAIAHLKIGLKLRATGYLFGTEERARIYLTNALEPPVDETGRFDFVVPVLADEATEVDDVKRRQRFTVVVGNPPYNNRSENTNKWIMELIDLFKTRVRHEETQIQALSDDYVKFLRLADWNVARAGTGVVGMITNNGYLDGHIFRDLRLSFMQNSSSLMIVNLHGDGRKKERTPDGGVDKNVFDIMQGVCILTMVRIPRTVATPDIRYSDLWGEREAKYSALRDERDAMNWTNLAPDSETASFVPAPEPLAEWNTSLPLEQHFGTGSWLEDKTNAYGSGFKSQQDQFAMAFARTDIASNIKMLLQPEMTEPKLRMAFSLCSTKQWSFSRARERLGRSPWETQIQRVLFRPFDYRYTLLDGDVVTNPRREIMGHLEHPNLAILATRKSTEGFAVFATDVPCGHKIVGNYDMTTVFPAYRYPNSGSDQLDLGPTGATSNLSPAAIERFSQLADADSALPEAVIHYAYAVFHSPSYRSRFDEHLRSGFPRVPAARQRALFAKLRSIGRELVSLHTMKSPALKSPCVKYRGSETPTVRRITWSEGIVWLDGAAKRSGNRKGQGTSGFHGVSEEAWNFKIGSYRICEKWLSDRKDRPLSDDDINHYGMVVTAIEETIRLMGEIDDVIEEHGGWPGAFVSGSRKEKM